LNQFFLKLSLPLPSRIDLVGLDDFTDENYSQIFELLNNNQTRLVIHGVTALHFIDPKIKQKFLDNMDKIEFPDVTELTLDYTPIQLTHLQKLNHCFPKLEKLGLQGCKTVTNSTLNEWHPPPTLTLLNLFDTGLTENSSVYENLINKMNNLETIV